jgi:hypothetical protein
VIACLTFDAAARVEGPPRRLEPVEVDEDVYPER